MERALAAFQRMTANVHTRYMPEEWLAVARWLESMADNAEPKERIVALQAMAIADTIAKREEELISAQET